MKMIRTVLVAGLLVAAVGCDNKPSHNNGNTEAGGVQGGAGAAGAGTPGGTGATGGGGYGSGNAQGR